MIRPEFQLARNGMQASYIAFQCQPAEFIAWFRSFVAEEFDSNHVERCVKGRITVWSAYLSDRMQVRVLQSF